MKESKPTDSSEIDIGIITYKPQTRPSSFRGSKMPDINSANGHRTANVLNNMEVDRALINFIAGIQDA